MSLYGYCIECGEKGGGQMHHRRKDVHVTCFEAALKEEAAEDAKVLKWIDAMRVLAKDLTKSQRNKVLDFVVRMQME